MSRRQGGFVTCATFLVLGVSAALGSFAGDGIESVDFGGTDSPDAIAIQKDGKIVVAGSTDAGASIFDFAVARFEKDGDIDNSFAGDGTQTAEFGEFDVGDGVAIQKNGRIVVAGQTGADGVDDFALARYTKGGLPDDSFSNDGQQTTDFDAAAGANDVAIQDNGRIVAVGSREDDFAITRYRESGALDRSFSSDGKKTTNFGGFDGAEAVAIQGNGRIVVAGSSCVGGGMCANDNFAVARYKENGSLDKSFSKDGLKTANLGGSDRARDVAIQDDGRIVVAGSASPGDGADFAVARLKKNGGLDKSFSKDGIKTTNFGDSDTAEALAIQANDKIVLVGSTQATPTVDFALARYKPDGKPDRSFSGDGKQTTDIGGSGDAAQDIAFQSRRTFIVAGVVNPDQDFTVARYKNAQLDD